MIEYVKGQIAELTPAIAVIDCHGVGYGLNISFEHIFSPARQAGSQTIRLRSHPRRRLRALRFFHPPGTCPLPAAHQRVGHRGQHGTHDSLRPHTGRIGQRHQFRQRQAAQDRERHRAENRPTHHRGPERQNRIDGNRRDGSPRHFRDRGNRTFEILEEAVAALTMLGFPPAPRKRSHWPS